MRFSRNIKIIQGLIAFILFCSVLHSQQSLDSIIISESCFFPDEFVDSISIQGKKAGQASWNDKCLKINLSSMKVEKYSKYSDEHPFTGGKRCIVYVSTDNEKSAEFAFFIYSDLVAIRKESFRKGFYHVNLGVYKFDLSDNILTFSIPFSALNISPVKVWATVKKTKKFKRPSS